MLILVVTITRTMPDSAMSWQFLYQLTHYECGSWCLMTVSSMKMGKGCHKIPTAVMKSHLTYRYFSEGMSQCLHPEGKKQINRLEKEAAWYKI